jgi:hypothetical protein
MTARRRTGQPAPTTVGKRNPMKPFLYNTIVPFFVVFSIATVILKANPYGYYLIEQAGGMVQDVPKTMVEAQKYVQDENKLNFMNASKGDAQQSYIALQGMEKTYGDGSGVPGYVPKQLAADPQVQLGINSYAQNLPNTPEGANLKNYLQRQQARDQMLLAYSARLRAQATAANQPSLTLVQCASISNSLANFGYDNRIQAINEAAESDSLKAHERDQQLQLREYQQQRDDADSAWK